MRTVLVVEDSVEIVDLVEMVLRPAGYRIVRSSTGAAGLASARNENPDLVILDLHLPDLHGEELLRMLRTGPATAGIPVVILSGDSATLTDEGRAMAAAVLGKPFNPRHLLAVVRDLVDADTAAEPGR